MLNFRERLHIQDAIDASIGFYNLCLGPPTDIYIKSGTYTLASQVEVNSMVTILGGFPNGMANPTLGDRDWQAYPAIVDGNNSVRCFNVSEICTIDGLTFQNGHTSLNAGAIYIDQPPFDCSPFADSRVRIRNCRFINNFAGVHGGAIYDLRSDASIDNCYFSGNSADNAGAIKQWEAGTIIDQCIFDGNEATGFNFGGGAILSDGGAGQPPYGSITNCLFVNNTSDVNGGAISYHNRYPTITNSTFADNVANQDGLSYTGGAIYNNVSAPTIKNCIFWDDSPDEVVSYFHGTGPEINFSDIEGGWGGAGANNIQDNPQFVGANDYHLNPATSPCIDAGSNVGDPPDDLEGNPRPADGDGNGTATTDMGAYEYQPPMIDLVIDSITLVPPSPQIGELVEITVAFSNQGTSDAGSFWVDWYADLASSPGTPQSGTKFDLISSLAAGATDTMVVTHTYTTSGAKNMYAQIDTDEDVVETDENNNIFGPQTANVTDVDLRVTSITYDPISPRIGEPITITVGFTNEGTTDAGDFYVDWYANRTSAPGPGMIGDRAQHYSSLAAGVSNTMVKTYTYTTEGTYKTYAQIDTDEDVVETNEGNNVYGYRTVHAYDGELIDFNIEEDTANDEHWFGGDDAIVRNVGIGQGITLDHDARVQYAGFRFSEMFDYDDNPDGYGHQVQLRLYIRNASGTIIKTSVYYPQASFNGGWVKFYLGTNFWLEAGEEYIFTCYQYDGEDTQLNSWVYAHTGDIWPTSQGYRAIINGSPADMVTWANWTTHSWDFNFAMMGQYVDKYPGDVNDDRAVNIGDVDELLSAWLFDDCVPDTWCGNSDINWDKDVQYADFSVVSRFWGNTYYGYEDLNRDAIITLESQMSGSNIDGSNGNEFNPGTYFVYKTSQGRYGKFMVENYDAASHALTIAWVTYNFIGTVYSSGSGLVIGGTWGCDLDVGAEVSTLSTTADFAWAQPTGTTRYLDPRNGAIFKLMFRAP